MFGVPLENSVAISMLSLGLLYLVEGESEFVGSIRCDRQVPIQSCLFHRAGTGQKGTVSPINKSVTFS